MFRNTLYVVAGVVCLLLTGCSSQTTQHKYTIGVVPKGQTHEFWQSIERGARRAAADLAEQGVAVRILWDAPLKESDAAEQIAKVQQLVNSRGINGLVLAPQDSKGMVPVVRETVSRNIPVVIIDSGLADPDLFVKYVATDNYNGGKMAARHLLEVLAQRGKTAPRLVLFRYAVGSESTEQREKGFLDEVNRHIEQQKAAGKDTARIIADQDYAGATVDTAMKSAGPMLIRVKDEADGIFAVNESAAVGLLNVLRSQKLNQKIRVVSFDSSGPLLQALEEGDLDGTIVQDPYRMGYLGVWTLVRHLEGDDVSVGGKYLSTGETLVTKENLNELSTRELFTPELQQKRTIQLPQPKK